MEKVFISYRRDDSADITDRIYEHLSNHFGKDAIFIDIADIPLGVDFRTHIEGVIAKCAVQLVVIGPNWLDAKSPEGGRRRLDDPADFVRIEVETGLKRGIPVIPLLVGGASVPKAENLPESLAPLAFRNSLPIRRNPDFYNDMSRLIKALEPIMEPPQPPVAQPATGETQAVTAPSDPSTVASRRTQVLPPALPNKIKTDDAWLYETTEHALSIPVGTPRVDKFGIRQVWITPGCFVMGSDPDNDPAAQPEETPIHEVCLSAGFWVDVFPVTNAAFATFVADKGYLRESLWSKEGWEWVQQSKAAGPEDYLGFTNPEQPRVGICWYEADAYARWRGGRLPTEAEWEYAGRGPQSLKYPWGNEYMVGSTGISEVQLGGNIVPATMKVGYFPTDKSWAGVRDMAGNVIEWCFDWFDATYYAKLVRDNPIGPAQTAARSARGGSWDGNEVNTRLAMRRAFRPTFRVNYIGTRVVSP